MESELGARLVAAVVAARRAPLPTADALYEDA